MNIEDMIFGKLNEIVIGNRLDYISLENIPLITSEYFVLMGIWSVGKGAFSLKIGDEETYKIYRLEVNDVEINEFQVIDISNSDIIFTKY
ncbi:hypothetical protein [Gluconobacter sp. OJB]|uniref:hypothetical protein n=1 Tax=Gluconobacter sp. OJB TaxID=3145196 RepID=UPI0031F83B73